MNERLAYSQTISSTQSPRKRLRPADVLVRAATAELLRQPAGHDLFENIAKTVARHYGSCPATLAYIERAAVNPANTAVATWASELVQNSVVDFMATDMQRVSGFAQLAQRALMIPIDTAASVKIPSRASPLALQGAWIGESNAKPVFQAVLGVSTLVANKLSAISTFTEEMVNSSSIELIMREVLAHDLSALLDTALFDATAASAGVRPAGIFNGATSVTASALTPANEAMIADLRGLGNAVSGTGSPDAVIAFVVNPQQALRINIVAPQYQNLIVSGYMTAGTVGAIDVGGVAMTISQPQFQVSGNATLHMVDASPAAIGTVGSPNVVAAPTRSLFQEDEIGLRCVLRAGWIKRRAAASAISTSVVW